jgi:hypothetical protein
MLTNQNLPRDANIVAGLVFVSATIGFLCLVLQTIGILHVPSDYGRPVLFGILSLTSDSALGIHTFLTACASAFCAYGLMKGKKFGWWMTLIVVINGISDSLLIFGKHPIAATVSICFGAGIIGWLLYRKHLYGIGKIFKRK